MIPLSQSHLTLLDTCARKYQYVFFDALSTPSTYEQQLTSRWGSQFHLLMQQRSLNLPTEVLAGANAEMAASMTALAQSAPDVFAQLSAASSQAHAQTTADPSAEPFIQSEHRRTLVFDDYLLTAVYDLVILSAEQGQLFDWKTHQRRPLERQLRDNWQTRLYLYVLCETTDLNPEQLSMTYWFVRSKQERAAEQPSFSHFGYSAAQHQLTYQALKQLTGTLSQMRQRFEFPKVAIEKGLCDRCLFNVRCDRARSSASLSSDPQRLLREASELTADMVQEIPL